MAWVVMLLAAMAAEASAARLGDTIVGKILPGASSGPRGPVTHLVVPKDSESLLSTVGSSVSFGGGGGVSAAAAPSTVVPLVVTPELVTASIPETSIDMPQSPPTAAAVAAAAGRFNLSAAAHVFFGPEDVVKPPRNTPFRRNGALARRSDSGPSDPGNASRIPSSPTASDPSRSGQLTTSPVKSTSLMSGPSPTASKPSPSGQLTTYPVNSASLMSGPSPTASEPSRSGQFTISPVKSASLLSSQKKPVTGRPSEQVIVGLRRSALVRRPPSKLREPASQPADMPQTRRVITAAAASLPVEPTTTTEAVTVSEALQCPQNHAYWAASSRCVPIGKRGPCPAGSVIRVSEAAEVSCSCQPGHLAWTDGRCYLRFSAGPCGDGGVICESESGPAECRCRSGYGKGRDGRCYQHYTRADCPVNNVFIGGKCVAKGPCPETFFMVFNVAEQKYSCGCPAGFLLVQAVNRCIRARTSCRHCVENLYLWPGDGRYYQELTRGPCNSTELLIHKEEGPVCGCGKYAAGDRLGAFMEPTALWPLDGRCYRLYERAICPQGQWFIWSSTEDRMPVCCPRGHYFWPADGKCYEEFSRGPCPRSQLFVNVLRNSVCTCDDQWGFTVTNPEDGTCYLRNTQGPCKRGFRFLGSRDGQKVCDCMQGEFYHEDSGECFPLYHRGPCAAGEWLVFAAAAGRAVCRPSQCPQMRLSSASERLPKARLLEVVQPKPFVYWKVTDRCYQIDTQGPCSENFRLQLDEYGITPTCQLVHERNREVPVQAPLNEMSRCPPGSYRAISRSCLPVLVTNMDAGTTAVCGDLQAWQPAERRCRPLRRQPAASCPATYHPYPEGGVCVCPRGQYPAQDGSCRPTDQRGPGPLHWTIHNYLQKVQQQRLKHMLSRRL